MILFRDIITAYHKEMVINEEDGTVQERRADVPFIDGIPCQISYAGDDRGAPKGRERLPQERQIKIFVWFDGIPKGQAFRRGDYVMFERRDAEGGAATHHEGVIGEPRVYTRGIAHVELTLEAQE
jgi:hypothetical protein